MIAKIRRATAYEARQFYQRHGVHIGDLVYTDAHVRVTIDSDKYLGIAYNVDIQTFAGIWCRAYRMRDQKTALQAFNGLNKYVHQREQNAKDGYIDGFAAERGES